jgi:hypothetical protein
MVHVPACRTGPVRMKTFVAEARSEDPVVLALHHDHDAVNALYRVGDVCRVTSLQDGMNLVCKEFVAARGDERDVLMSRLAGAVREMPEALRQPAPREGNRRRAVPAAGDARGRAPRADGQPAHLCARIQRLSLGRPDAGRCRSLEPSRADGAARPAAPDRMKMPHR